MTVVAPPIVSSWVIRSAVVALAAVLAVLGLLLLLVVAAISGAGNRTSSASATGLRADSVPSDLAPIFVAAAKTCDLSPALLAAQARQESGFRRDAVSRAGAVGLMQFMPGTWATIGVDGSGDRVADPHDASDAIYSGARYDCQIRDQLRHAGLSGDLDRLMLAAYNAGPPAVLGCGCVPAYSETQGYVTAVLSFAAQMTASAAGSGVPAELGRVVYPLAARGVPTSPFGWRTSPVTGTSEFHAGQDLAAPAGTPVLAATSGTVTTASWVSGYGNYACVDRDAHFRTCYGHLAAFSVEVGQPITAGQQVGLEGSTGDATGPHLHFEVRLDGVPTNPLPYLP